MSSHGVAEWIAADPIAQAEHDPDARAVLFTPSPRLARAVAAEIARQLPDTGPAAAALKNNGGIVVSRSLTASIALCQQLAPEHAVCDSDAVAARRRAPARCSSARSAPQACGDDVTGSNHVLADQRRRIGARRPQRRATS